MSSTKPRPSAPEPSSGSSADQHRSFDLDRQLFHLKTLYESSRELLIASSPEELLKQILPLVMGPLGLTFGFAVMLRSDVVLVECLGLDAAAREHFEQMGSEFVGKFFPAIGTLTTISRPTILVGHHLSHDPNLPVGTHAVVAVSVDDCSQVVLGFGPKLSEEPYREDEIELLHGEAAIFSSAFKKSCAETRVRDLNADLSDKNRRMESTLATMERAREELDRRAFHLQTLYETTFELSRTHDVLKLLDTFLLTIMGIFSFSIGWITQLGPEGSQADTVYRGPDPEGKARLATPETRAAVLTEFIKLKDRMPRDNQSVLLEESVIMDPMPVPTEVVVLFAIDQGWRGAIGLGGHLSDEPMADAMKQLLHAMIGTFIVTMGNAKHIQLIQGLNRDLAARNVALQTTLDALTTAEQEIGTLTEAKERIIRLVKGEVARVWRASWLDVSLIILAGVVLGTLFNFSSPSGIELIPKSLFETPPVMVDAATVNRMFKEGEVVIIDARPAEFYTQGHIRGAVCLPKDLFNFVYSMKLAEVDPDTLLIVYGRTVSRLYDVDVARELRLLGHENIMLLDGGLSAWEEGGYEVEK